MHASTSSPVLSALGRYIAMAAVIGTAIGSGVFRKPTTVAENVHFFGLAALVWIGGGVLGSWFTIWRGK